MGGVADRGGIARDHFQKCPIALVQVQVVVFKKIIPHIDVGIPVFVHVADAQAQAIPGFPLVDAGVGANIRKMPPVVPVQAVARKRVVPLPLRTLPIGAVRVHGVVEQKNIEVAVEVEIEEGCLGGKARKVKAKFCSPFSELGHPFVRQALVDIKQVPARQGPVACGFADVNVKQAVAVHIGMGNARGPSVGVGDAGLGGDLLESEPAPVQVQGIGLLVRGKVEVGEPIPVEVGGQHPGPVIVIKIGQDIQLRAFGQLVAKVNPGAFRFQFLQQVWGMLLATSQCHS